MTQMRIHKRADAEAHAWIHTTLLLLTHTFEAYLKPTIEPACFSQLAHRAFAASPCSLCRHGIHSVHCHFAAELHY